MREVREELGVRLETWRFFRRCAAYPNIKHIFHAQIDRLASELTLYEGQRIAAIGCEERFEFRFANILPAILEDFAGSGGRLLWITLRMISRQNNCRADCFVLVVI